MRQLRTIRWRIAAWAAGFTLTALSLLAVYFFYRLIRNVDLQMDRFIDEESHEAERVLEDGDEALAKELREDEKVHERAGVWFQFTDGAGKVFFRSASLSPEEMRLAPEVLKQLATSARVWTRERIHGEPARTRTSKFVFPDGRVRYVQIALSEHDALASRANFFAQLSLAVVPCVLVALMGGFFVARRATAPIDDIAAAAARIQSTGLGERIPLRGTGDELDQLAVVLNGTFAALEESFRRIRNFSASASHQLKTPLTVIRGEAELLVRERPDDRDLARYATIAEEAAHLARIVDQLLFLARADAERVEVGMAPVGLKPVVERGLRRIEPYVTVKKLKVEAALDGVPDVMGSESLLSTAVQNLLDNAAKYAPEGGRLRIGWEAAGKLAALEIENDGAPIPQEDRESIMQRFSAEGSRPGQGAGLGLAVAREIAALHKGSLRPMDPRDGMGVRFRLEVPRA